MRLPDDRRVIACESALPDALKFCWATSELMSEMAFWVLPSPFVYVYPVMLGHCAATVTAE